jgi:hypothetical protein
MGQKLIITEEEKNRIKLLYEVVTKLPPDESILVANKNPYKYPEYESARRVYSSKLVNGDLFYELNIPYVNKFVIDYYTKLIKNDSLHESSCKATINGQFHIDKIYKYCVNRIENKKTPSKNSELYYQGKIFRNKDWKPEMLQFIYEVHKDEIVKNFYNPLLMKGLSYFQVNEKNEKEKKEK